MRDMGHIMLGLTAAERWAAARRLDARSGSEQWLILGAVAVLLVLLALLIGVSYRRYLQNKRRRAERFAEEALRRGLVDRERQVLLAIAARSGLRRAYDIFSSPAAFDQGTVRLLAEFAQTRMAQRADDLKAGIARLREKVGFRAGPAVGGTTGRTRSGSREIPVGTSLELSRKGEHEAARIRATVVRNDDRELAVDLRTPIQSKAGESWLSRYYRGTSTWEFDTSTARCDGKRLILNHSYEIRGVDRWRFPRVTVRSPALLAHFPFIKRDSAPVAATSGGVDVVVTTEGDRPALDALRFMEGTVTELAGPDLRIETSFRAQPEDRVLVMFKLVQRAGDNVVAAQHVVAAVGRVKRCQDTEHGSLMVVELTGLTDSEIGELASLTDEAFARAAAGGRERVTERDKMRKPVPAAT